MRGVKLGESKSLTQQIVDWLQAHPEGGVGAEISAELLAGRKTVQSTLTYLLKTHRIRCKRGGGRKSTDLRYFALEHHPSNQPQTKAVIRIRDEAKRPSAKRLDPQASAAVAQVEVKRVPGFERNDARADVPGIWRALQIGSYLPSESWASRAYR